MKLKEKNTFLKTNYKLRNTGSKFNSIGKIISMNYPFIQNNSEKKPKYKDKNFIKAENLFSNNKKEKSQNSNKINVNLSNVYNNQNQNELNKNHQEKKLFGTINHFSVNSSPQKDKASLPKLKINIKEDNNQIKNGPSQKVDMIYSNYFVNNKFQKPNNNNRIVNQTHNIFFFKSSGKFKKYNKKLGIQENKSNDSFTIKNSSNNIDKCIDENFCGINLKNKEVDFVAKEIVKLNTKSINTITKYNSSIN